MPKYGRTLKRSAYDDDYRRELHPRRIRDDIHDDDSPREPLSDRIMNRVEDIYSSVESGFASIQSLISSQSQRNRADGQPYSASHPQPRSAQRPPVAPPKSAPRSDSHPAPKEPQSEVKPSAAPDPEYQPLTRVNQFYWLECYSIKLRDSDQANIYLTEAEAKAEATRIGDGTYSPVFCLFSYTGKFIRVLHPNELSQFPKGTTTKAR